MSQSLAGRVALVTGAGSGIGHALALALARRGASLGLLDRDEAGLAATLLALGDVRGGGARAATRARAWLCDVRDPDRCRAVVDEAIAHFGGVDILVNNAGISHHSRVEETRLETLQRVMEVNFHGAVHCTLPALPSLRARRGAIVVLSSVAGFAPLVGRSAYAASKHALHGWFSTLRSELQGTGVSVMIVCPSFVRTAIDEHALSGDGGAAPVGKPVIGRLAAPEVIAAAICDGIAARRTLLVPTPVARLAWWLTRLSPQLYERIMRRRQSGPYSAKP